MAYYLAADGNDVLTHATTQMNLRSIRLREARHRKSHIVPFRLCEISKISKSTETESRLTGSGECGEERTGNNCLVGLGFPLG